MERPAADNGAKAAARVLVSLPVIVNLWLLRAELRTIEWHNDLSVHAAMVRWSGRAFRSLHIPLDDWFPYLTAGFPQFRQYQSAAHILMGPVAAVIGGDRTVRLSTYLLVAFWPVAIYVGVRLLGWDRWTAVAAALICPLLVSRTNYGFEYASYVWAGLGVWAQAWGMFVAPLALGLSWRALEQGRRYAIAALALAATFVFHVITGYFVFLALGVLFLFGLPSWDRLKRTALLGVAAAAISSWFIIPAMSGRAWSASRNPYVLPAGWDSFGVRRVLGWLVTGRLFDRGRFPTVTILVFIGLAVCLYRFRRDARARILVGFFALALVLFFGPAATGNVLSRIPGSGSILFQRYVSAVHLAGIFLAAAGSVFLVTAGLRAVRSVRANLPRAVAIGAVAAVSIAWLAPAWRERVDYLGDARRFIERQQRGEERDRGRRAELIALAREGGGGRIYSGRRGNWGRRYRVGFVQGYLSILNADAEGWGFAGRTNSMLRGIERILVANDPFFYDLFGIRYLLFPATRRPSTPAKRLWRDGRHALWEVETSGYFAIADTVEPIKTSRRYFTRDMRNFARDARRWVLPTIAFGGRPAAEPTASRRNPPAGQPGTTVDRSESAKEGRLEATVDARRRAAVVLKASFTPQWEVTVDGKKARPYLVAPGYPAVTVDPGRHTVVFRYVPYGLYPVWFLLAALVLGGLVWFDRRTRVHAGASSSRPASELPAREQTKDEVGWQGEQHSFRP